MASVQFYGKEKAIEAYQNAKIPAVAIFSGNQLIFRYGGNSISEGEDLLENFLTAIEHSNATYTLKVYENHSKDKTDLRIREKMECDLSFNFKILPEDEYNARRIDRGGYGANNQIMAAINDLKSEMADIRSGSLGNINPDPDDQPETINDILLGLLKEPAKIGQLISIGRSLLNGQPLPTMMPAAIGNHEKITDEISEDQKLEKLSAALDVLEKSDPKIVDHLVKLSQISQSNPSLFRMLIANLDQL